MINRFKNKPTAGEKKPGFFDALLQLFFPERCLLCRDIIAPKISVPLCNKCEKSYEGLINICPRCENFSRLDLDCGCDREVTTLSSISALHTYEADWRSLLHRLKYRRNRSLSRPLGSLLGNQLLTQANSGFDYVVPVPLHKKRERERGFNQSALIARHAAAALGADYFEFLVKTRETASQTAINRQDRLLNVRGAYKVVSPIAKGATVLLVDDIYSTGSTLKEAAKELKEAGAIVHGAVIAYNPPRFTRF